MTAIQERKELLLSNTSTRTLLETAIALEAVKHPSQEERMVRAWVFDELERRAGMITGAEDERFMQIYEETDSYLAALMALRPNLSGVT